jgi:hypothetical protein
MIYFLLHPLCCTLVYTFKKDVLRIYMIPHHSFMLEKKQAILCVHKHDDGSSLLYDKTKMCSYFEVLSI